MFSINPEMCPNLEALTQPPKLLKNQHLRRLCQDLLEVLPKVNLIFRMRRLRKQRLPLSVVCSSERPKGQ